MWCDWTIIVLFAFVSFICPCFFCACDSNFSISIIYTRPDRTFKLAHSIYNFLCKPVAETLPRVEGNFLAFTCSEIRDP